MSRPRVGISTTYKTRVALEVIVRNGKESVLDSEWTGAVFQSIRRSVLPLLSIPTLTDSRSVVKPRVRQPATTATVPDHLFDCGLPLVQTSDAL
jgi:hypothetical protein